MIRALLNIESLISELRELERELDDMDHAWASDNECDQAENAPGIQYEQGCKIDAKLAEIKSACAEIGGLI